MAKEEKEKLPTEVEGEAAIPSEAPEQAAGEPAEADKQTATAPSPPEAQHYFWGTGRRKKATARVRIRPGTGKILINKRAAEDYFTEERDRQSIIAPLEAVKMVKSWDVWANVNGGGFNGQAGAVTLGLARALAKAVPELETALRDQRLLTRDARMKERKKYGQKGARKRFQFSKR